ncbi:hypothetical protein [Brenneria roseae]|uniref:hypothetical protein n=1 Tax=Brenneria roseae TaxID=1509241 RepID=UPI001FECD763|nr:hypothetical protein [Brenneria roseae]
MKFKKNLNYHCFHGVINWAMIYITHLPFRSAKKLSHQETRFKILGDSITNAMGLLFLAGIPVMMAMAPEMQISVLLIPIWL